MTPDIFKYTDFRKYLLDFYEAKKSVNPHFSHRYAAQKLGLASTGHFSKILKGQTNISKALTLKFVDFLKLKKKEAEYFDLLVSFNQARVHAEKRHYFEKMASFARSKVKSLGADQYEYLDKWYYPAIRELLNFFPFRGDHAALAKMLSPRISPAQAEEAVRTLLKLGLVRKNAKGTFDLVDKTITSDPEIKMVVINHYQMAALDLAKESIDRFPRDQRNISNLILSVSEPLRKKISERIDAFRRELLELAKNDEDEVNGVHQINIQMFPLSKPHTRS